MALPNISSTEGPENSSERAELVKTLAFSCLGAGGLLRSQAVAARIPVPFPAPLPPSLLHPAPNPAPPSHCAWPAMALTLPAGGQDGQPREGLCSAVLPAAAAAPLTQPRAEHAVPITSLQAEGHLQDAKSGEMWCLCTLASWVACQAMWLGEEVGNCGFF